MKKTLLFMSALFACQLMTAQLYINEILVSPPGNDSPNEFIELRGMPNAVIPADTYLIQVEGDGEGSDNPGDVETNSDASNGCTVNGDGSTPCPQGGIIDLSGLTLGSNGILVILSTGYPYTVDPAATILLDVTDGELEDKSHTFLLVNTNGNGAPSTNDDIDADNDGEIDVAYTSIWTILDGVSMLDDDNAANGAGGPEYAYSDVVFVDDITNTNMNVFAPSTATIVGTTTEYDYVARIGNSTGSMLTNNETTSDWLGGNLGSVTDLTTENWTITSSGGTGAYPDSFIGSELNHIGSPNPSNNTLSAPQFEDLNGMSIFPNPAKNRLTVKSSKTEISSVEMYNILGAKVLTDNTLTNNAVDVSKLKAGVYLLKINSGSNSVTKRVIIE